MNDENHAPVEEWRFVIHEPKYEVSILGRVRRAAPYRSTTVGNVLKPIRHRDGHLQVRLCGVLCYVHRLVAEAFHGPAPILHYAAHNNGIPSQNDKENVRWATPKENFEDRLYHGAHTFGEQNPNVRLTDEQVRLVRARFHVGRESKACLSRLFGVSDSHIHRIVTNRLRYSAGGYM